MVPLHPNILEHDGKKAFVVSSGTRSSLLEEEIEASRTSRRCGPPSPKRLTPRLLLSPTPRRNWGFEQALGGESMIELPYSLVIEVTQIWASLGFIYRSSEGFTGVPHR